MQTTINGKVTYNSSYFSFYATVSATPNTAGNYSDVTVSTYWQTTSTTRTFDTVGTRPASIIIDGTETAIEKRFDLNPWPSNPYLIQTATKRVYHDNNGSKIITISARANGRASTYGPSSSTGLTGDCTLSANVTLDTIPRKSSLTVGNGTLNTSQNIKVTRESTSFWHSIKAVCGSSTLYIKADGTTQTSEIRHQDCDFNFTPPADWASQKTDGNSASVTYTITTYTAQSGGTNVGSTSYTKTCTIPNTAPFKPSCSVALDDVSGTDDMYGSPVQGLSTIKFTIAASAKYGSSIVSRYVYVDGVQYSVSTATTTGIPLAKSGSIEAKVIVTDKRRNSAEWSYTMNVQPYSKPVVSKVVAKRCNADGTINKRGAYIKATFTANVKPMNNLNIATYTLKYKKTSQSESGYVTVPISALNNNYSPTDYTTAPFAASISNSYDVTICAADRHTGSKPGTLSTKASSGASIFSWRGFKNSSGVVEDGAGIGKIPEKWNTLQVGWRTEFDKTVQFSGNSYVFQPSSFNGAKGYTLLAEITISELNANAPIVFVINRRGAASPMTVYVRFAGSSTSLDPDLASITYEGSNFGVFMIKSATSTWRLYVDNTSGWINPCLQAWYTTSSQESRLSVSFPTEQITTLPEPWYRATPAKLQSILDFIYPVGSIYFSYSHTSPASLFGGTWTRIENRFLWASDSGGEIGRVSGSQTHTLTVDEMPSHKHELVRQKWYGADTVVSSSTGTILAWTGTSTSASYMSPTGRDIRDTGGGAAHNNMPPFIQVSVWRRTE